MSLSTLPHLAGKAHPMTVGLSRIGVFIITLAVLLAACGDRSPDTLHYTGATMGTYYSVKVPRSPREVRGSHGIDTERLGRDIKDILEEVNALMSTYREDSELSRFNVSRRTDWFPVSRELHTVVSEALRVSRLTGGAFDITVGPLINLWGFGPLMDDEGDDDGDKEGNEEPEDGPIEEEGFMSTIVPRNMPRTADLRATMTRIGYEKISTRATPPALRKDDPKVYLDLSAIAKGFAVDKVAEYLERMGLTDYLVDIGGELRGKGRNGAGKPWQVAIEKPMPDRRAIHQVIAIDDRAVATSGDYRNFFEKAGRRYSHTIDPKTGRPITHALASVTVIDPSAMRADALATAISVLGPQAGYQLAKREGIPVRLIIKTETGFTDRGTPAFDGFVVAR
uniref:FAD:protein FMN transferase n=1 Tax=Candidatus Kentrum sp. FM TaxID=2126340 RepID=A0A450TMR8_9GAMM|nr:MAG: thiamine biosynthesis lipoprotein [Candidatus Kentron sp. FM]VFJ69376.1 MAG: thiamine biosynthesis lipoprotein [Candidatus Kentron sp. FM]VFK17507.1 MAG: thiamine biosynthesis lipoprotein [Candidatus Kentron sp. FM]